MIGPGVDGDGEDALRGLGADAGPFAADQFGDGAGGETRGGRDLLVADTELAESADVSDGLASVNDGIALAGKNGVSAHGGVMRVRHAALEATAAAHVANPDAVRFAFGEPRHRLQVRRPHAWYIQASPCTPAF